MSSTIGRSAMEQALGKLVMDEGFREAFFHDSINATSTNGIELSDHERSVLRRIRPGALAAFQRYLARKQAASCFEVISA
jgi:hypothetical protein